MLKFYHKNFKSPNFSVETKNEKRAFNNYFFNHYFYLYLDFF